MVDTLSTSLRDYVSMDLGSSWAARSWDPAFTFQQERARFQQRQLQEKEEKLLRLYEEQQERQERALQRVKGPGAETDGRRGPSMGTAVGAGKVRSLLQCRREHGRDKSYPLEPLASLKPTRKPSNVIYFGGSHQDLRFSDELDYNQSFQVINDQLVYHGDGDYVKDFQNKREFYEQRFATVEDNYSADPFQKLPNVGRISQRMESPNKFKTFVSGKSTVGAGRSALPTRTITAPAKKTVTSPTVRKPASLKSTDTQRNGSVSEELKKNGLPVLSTAPARPPTGRKTVSPPHRAAKPDSPATVAPPVPASRTTIKPPSQRTSDATLKTRQSVAANPNLVSCRNCGRNFASDRVGQHESICKKTTTKKRKVFETVKHRVEGTEAAKYVLTGINERNAKKAEKVIAAKSNWRRKHEEFINNIRAAKGVQEHLKKGGKLSDLPPPPPSDYSDYVQCPHCQRKFNETAAARHVPACANMQHNKPRPAPTVRSSSTFRKK